MRIAMLLTAGIVGISLAAPAFAQNNQVPPDWSGATLKGGPAHPSARAPARRGAMVAQGPIIGTPLGGQTNEPGTLGVESTPRGSTMNPTNQANW
jgi:hypothetical protein